MDAIQLGEDLVQFNSYLEPIGLSFNQYLLMGPEPLLVHTGTVVHATALLPRLEETLGGRDLAYVFASHFESDECGGLAVLRKRYPDARLLCSDVTARQLGGFGIASECLPQAPGAALEISNARLEFLAYPSEVHLGTGSRSSSAAVALSSAATCSGGSGRWRVSRCTASGESWSSPSDPTGSPRPPPWRECGGRCSTCPCRWSPPVTVPASGFEDSATRRAVRGASARAAPARQLDDVARATRA